MRESTGSGAGNEEFSMVWKIFREKYVHFEHFSVQEIFSDRCTSLGLGRFSSPDIQIDGPILENNNQYENK